MISLTECFRSTFLFVLFARKTGATASGWCVCCLLTIVWWCCCFRFQFYSWNYFHAENYASNNMMLLLLFLFQCENVAQWNESHMKTWTETNSHKGRRFTHWGSEVQIILHEKEWRKRSNSSKKKKKFSHTHQSDGMSNHLRITICLLRITVTHGDSFNRRYN